MLKTLKTIASTLLVLGLISQPNAYAATKTLDFTFQADPLQQLPDSAGTLTLTDVAGGVQFLLQGDFAWLGPGSFLTELLFSGPQGTVGNLSGNTFNLQPTFGTYNDAGYSFTWDTTFPTSNAPGSDRFLPTDFASWTISGAGIDVTDFSNLAMLHIQGINYNTEGSIKIVSVVPEAETYSMMLLGLGLMGFVARRRRNMQA